ncbi:MAG: hypothetical protein J7623_29025 [Chitinophaga sp.]|uniref:hypothetical protein n=1 Tax=Chitinophaga sp. TaxID=1869181 RepID=UPI001B083741|nr:hypothetical protein [Chitinophaga sp.]MBO9732722.1 hypothetical protein [Chitinophaga sp.]
MNPFPVVAKISLLLVSVCCLLSITASGQKNPMVYQHIFQTDPWLKYWAGKLPHFDLSAFQYIRTSDFENRLEDDHLSDNDREFQQTFGKLISYTPDKKMYLDFYSAMMVFDTVRAKGKITVTPVFDVDQYLFIGDYRRHTLKRLMVMEFSDGLEEAAWLSDSTFILVGTKHDGDYCYPFIYIGNLKRQKFDYYLLKSKNHIPNRIYRSLKWNRLKNVKFEE